jgi:hypothetical protein
MATDVPFVAAGHEQRREKYTVAGWGRTWKPNQPLQAHSPPRVQPKSHRAKRAVSKNRDQNDGSLKEIFERMMRMAAESGWEVTDTDEEADKSDVVARKPKKTIMFL